MLQCKCKYIFTTVQKFGVFNCLWKKSLMLIKAAFIWRKKLLKTVILWNVITINTFLMYILKYIPLAEFSAAITQGFTVMILQIWSDLYIYIDYIILL